VATRDEAPHLGEVDHAKAASEAPGQIGGQVLDQSFAIFGALLAALFEGDVRFCFLRALAMRAPSALKNCES
jgi:hypothetical protein